MLELYFAQNRFYDPADRRFTQEDIVKDSHNWYAYCGNNPTLHVDPLGLRGEEIVDSLQGIFDEIREYASEQREWWSERWSEIYEWLTTSRSMSQLTYGLSNNFNYFARNTCDVMYAATLLANYIQISNCNTTNSDGEYQYIYNQNSEPIGSLPFGLSTFAHSGCGVVATYNSLITLGKPESLADVDLAYGIIGKNIGGWLGVHPEAITEFFESRDDINVKPVYKEDVSSLAEFDEIFANADAAIVTYWIYGKSATIHNVAIRPIRDSFGRVTDIYTYNEYSDMHEEFSRLSIEEMLKSGNRDVIVINYLYNTAAGDTSVVSNIPSIEELSAKRKNGGGTRSIDLKM